MNPSPQWRRKSAGLSLTFVWTGGCLKFEVRDLARDFEHVCFWLSAARFKVTKKKESYKYFIWSSQKRSLKHGHQNAGSIPDFVQADWVLEVQSQGFGP